MKTQFCLLLILLSTFRFNLIAQESSKSAYPWSISFSYSPKINISKSGFYAPYQDQTFIFSLDNKIDHRFSKHFSLTFGIDINKVNYHTEIIESVGSQYFNQVTSIKTLLLEFPAQINYHFRDTAVKFDPYLKIAFRNAFNYQHFEDYSAIISSSLERIDYYNFVDIGFGCFIELTSKFSLKYEASFGKGLNYQRSNYYFVEGLLGIRYKL